MGWLVHWFPGPNCIQAARRDRNELINQLVQKAGLTEEQASKAVGVIKEYIQGQLPPMMQGMVDNFLQGGAKSGDDFLG